MPVSGRLSKLLICCVVCSCTAALKDRVPAPTLRPDPASGQPLEWDADEWTQEWQVRVSCA